MKRALSLLPCLLVWVACVDSSCPAGSIEVDGRCQSTGALEGDAGESDGGDGDQGRDGGVRADGGDGDDAGGRDGGAGDGAVDEEAPGDPCEQLSCGEHAHCEVEDDAASCVCDEDYEGDGETCELDPCAADPCDAETSACQSEESEAVCACLDGFDRCDGDELACTTNLDSDAENCGACDAACAGNLACAVGACEQKIVQLSLGAEHSCALAPDGEILCWGSDIDSQLQHVDPGPPDHEPGVTTIGTARLLATGVATSCAVLVNGELVCWGSNDPFFWVASGAQRGVFRLGSELGSVESISVGNFAACLLDSGAAHCWGLAQAFEGSGETMQYDFANRLTIKLPSDITQLSMGNHTCAVSADQRVRCWGYGVETPQVIEDASGPIDAVEHVAVASFGFVSCALVEDGRVLCWGANDKGQLGNVGAALTATRAETAVPVTDQEGNPLVGFTQVAVGSKHGCGLRDDGTVMCWGQANRLGGGSSSSAAQAYATEVRDLDDAIDVAAGDGHTCVRRKSGQVQCWGDNNQGQLGVARLQIGGIASSAVPTNVSGLP
jgi:hypothetical protein